MQEQVALEKPFCRLIRFKRFTDDVTTLDAMKSQPTVLVVAPLSGHHATLLRDTVRSLLQDHKVYITDWTDARMVPTEAGPFHLDDYIAYVQEFIGHIGADVHVISVCQPTVPVLAAVSLLATAGKPTPLSMTMMGGPIDARKSPTAVNNLAMNRSFEWFENNVIYRVPQNYPGSQRRVYPGFLQHTGFVAMNPDRHATSHYDYFLDLVRGDEDSADAHRKFYDEYNAVLDLPAEYYLDTIKTVFQEYSLVNGTWVVKGQLVRPQDIQNSAMLTIEGELDDISGAGQTRAAHDLCTGIPIERQFHYDVVGAGHYGIFAGSRWRDIVYPQVRDFIKRFESERFDDPARDALRQGAGHQGREEGQGLRRRRRRPRADRAQEAGRGRDDEARVDARPPDDRVGRRRGESGRHARAGIIGTVCPTDPPAPPGLASAEPTAPPSSGVAPQFPSARRRCPMSRAADAGRPHRRAAAADSVHALRLSRLSRLCGRPRRRRSRPEPVSAGRRGRRPPTRPAPGPAGPAAGPGQRRRRAAPDRLHRRGRLHRLHLVHPGLPGRRDHRRAQAHARGRRVAVHRLRAVHPGLSGGLHRPRGRQRRRDRLGGMVAGTGRRRARARYAQRQARLARDEHEHAQRLAAKIAARRPPRNARPDHAVAGHRCARGRGVPAAQAAARVAQRCDSRQFLGPARPA